MKITLLLIGKTSSPAVKQLCGEYAQRISHYAKLEVVELESRDSKSGDIKKLKEKEEALALKKIAPADFVILLDEKGKEYNSVQFAQYLESLFNQSLKNIIFISGGAFGFGTELMQRANAKISLSKMTFSHQMVRVIFLEQLYRAFTIIHREPYHHE